MFAMTEIVEAVPPVAAQEGVGRVEWANIASKSRAFGGAIAHSGTNAQSLLRDYLVGTVDLTSRHPFQTKLLRLDDELGITTIEPLDELLAETVAVGQKFEEEGSGQNCTATQSPIESLGKTFYDATWDSYVAGTDRLIFPSEFDEPTPYDFSEPLPGDTAAEQIRFIGNAWEKAIEEHRFELSLDFLLKSNLI